MEENESIDGLLLWHGVRPTANRIIIARTLSEAGRPLSMTELEEKIGSIDKSNISRTLAVFRENHLVHTIEDGSENVRYELCHSKESGEGEHDDDEHCHFYCEKCRRTFCLEKIPVPEVNLPQGYELHDVNYVIKGICPDCGAER